MSSDEVAQIKLLTIGDSGKILTMRGFYIDRQCHPPVVVGKGVGKTWLLLRWAGVTGRLSTIGSSMPTIGIDFKMKTAVVHGRRMKVQVVS
jgi:hypothetical protein